MNFGSIGAITGRSESPALSSRAPSPQLRSAKQEVHEDPKVEKALRRYGANIERTLATWEIAPEEWADYIAFLSRLLKAVQSRPDIVTLLPHSASIASKLAQCLNPNLPSGVHQKALEVYSYIFSTFGKDHISTSLGDYLPGLFPLLSFASLSVRPALYELLEDHVANLGPRHLRSVLKSFILSLLPALEDETSEDFDRALTILIKLGRSFSRSAEEQSLDLDDASFFWQSVYLAIITSPSRRQGGLNFLSKRSISFATPLTEESAANGSNLSSEAEAAMHPDPGLLVRAFSCGLADTQPLVQRGFLDLLVSTLPLHSDVLQRKVSKADLHMLFNAVLGILLRRDMSLNRRVWQWFSGPEQKDENAESVKHGSQLNYFIANGRQSLLDCLVEEFGSKVKRPGDRARPFRISLSLMDRSDISSQILPQLFLPAMNSAFTYSNSATKAETSELLKSVSLFFDGVESQLIWNNLFELLKQSLPNSTTASTTQGRRTQDPLQALLWILKHFNVREDDMTVIYAPRLALYAFTIVTAVSSSRNVETARILTLIQTLINITSTRAFLLETSNEEEASQASMAEVLGNFFQSTTIERDPPFGGESIRDSLLDAAIDVLTITLAAKSDHDVGLAAHILISMIGKSHEANQPFPQRLATIIEAFAQQLEPGTSSFERLSVMVSLMTTAASLARSSPNIYYDLLVDLEPNISASLLHFVGPTESMYSIDAIRLLWRIDGILREEDAIRGSIQYLLTQHRDGSQLTAVRTVLNLWNLSVSLQPSTTKSPMVGSRRRVSGSVVNADLEKSSRMMHVMREPMSIILDALAEPSEPVATDISLWLNQTHNAETIIQSLMESIDSARTTSVAVDDRHLLQRAAAGSFKTVEYALRQLSNVLKQAQLAFWLMLSDAHIVDTLPGPRGSGVSVIVKHCLNLLPGSQANNAELHHLALDILTQLFDGPPFIMAQIQTLDIKTELMKHLFACLQPKNAHMQPVVLRLLAKAIMLSSGDVVAKPEVPRHSVHIRRVSTLASLAATDTNTPVELTVPVQPLVQLLRQAFSAAGTRPYLNAWLDFLAEVLPTLGELLSANLLPLTETMCNQLEEIFEQIVVSTTGSGPLNVVYAPESTIIRLLDALEIILRTAHEILLTTDTTNEHTQVQTASTVLDSVTPNMFKQQGNPSKTASANTRLTITLSAKDVARACTRIYVWSCNTAESTDIDKFRAASASHTAQKLRNRVRHMLEGLFSIEMLETLEAIAFSWREAGTQESKLTIMSLLHVLHTTRPKTVVPAILDALCSRTNPSILSPGRMSSLTTELSSGSMALFYSAYLESLEDDALDEIWSDCTAFMRDVLSNPLPYRSILPSLLWIAFQLAEKLDNTNFGEKKRMRRELGDTFQRLLTATFTTIPAGSITSNEDRLYVETSFATGLEDLNLLVILRELVVRAEIILETSDKVATCINAITTYIITPSLRSKTFPNRVSTDVLALTVRIAKKLPSSKVWRRDVTDAFNDPRFILTPASVVTRQWFPILQQMLLSDKERMAEILGRLSAPSSAGIMFGVGANAARLDADRKTQLNLRRVALLCLASPLNGQLEHLRTINEKMAELFEATAVSSPSSIVKAELFMLTRAVLLSVSPIHFAAFWPIVNDNLKQALLSTILDSSQSTAYNNLTLLQACKLLDLLVAISPEEFQLQEWVFVTNTTDAVYHSPDWSPIAIADQLADALSDLQIEEDVVLPDKEPSHSPHIEGVRGPLLKGGAGYDTEDIRAMSRDVFLSNSIRPFLNQLSIQTYESRYRLDKAELLLFRTVLVEDIQDPGTIIT